ncbi:phage/plasmid primase, P4 family [uncultured Sphingomonas sp.]|uniref:DNA primase family protein n=1 Tax=uncultured Sphingomonas sp. TaxID=158754 RepID=UPI0025D4C047|nr:phage/plasmid primase, P4 family [uncultured Sphingomonas sp.]
MALKELKSTTGINLGTLRAEAMGGRDGEPDHLALARAALAQLGAGNVLFAQSHFWQWSPSGVWRQRDDLAIRSAVQQSIESAGHTITASRVNGVTDVLRNEVYRPDQRFNIGSPEVVNCLNGELELTATGWMLQPHRRDDYRTTQIPTAYDPTAHAPLFWQFLHDVFRDDADCEVKAWAVLEMMGYSLMSHARLDRFVLLIGNGANGKSVLLRVMEALAGRENVAGVKPGEFGNKFQRAHLHMKLANIVSELPEGKLIDDDGLKAITSGELTTVEQKNRDPFDMRAFSTCWFGTNHLPHTRDFSDGLFRRSLILTFNRKFADHEQDRDLAGKLIGELPGILNYALGAYARALSVGFTMPPSALAAREAWRCEADQVRQFVNERCEADPSASIRLDDLYRSFDLWARSSGVRNIVGIRVMGTRLEGQGYRRRHSGGTVIDGLRLRPL